MKNPVKFGKYYLLERINVGGMAEVFKAKSFGEAGFERLVAVKRVLPSIAEDQEFIAMFIDEAKLAVQLTHPNIAQIFELGKVGEAYFIALEYVPGKDLRAIFDRGRKRGEPLPIPMASYMVMKICEGLDYAHNKKDAAGRNIELVHRDVSPQNMLISYEGDVKLIDFGIAKAASKSSRTQAGILKGKFGYMSPEQVRGLQIDRRSDIFSVGICLYELLTMERLFVGESDFSTLEKVRNVEIMPPSTYNRKIPEELEQIVLKALAKHPEDRYRTAMDLHDDLQSFMYTSGNFFARKDLSAYMHRIFQDEIAKEASKDDEYRKFDSRRASDLDVFDNAAAPASAAPRNTLNAPPPPPVPPRASLPPPPPPQAMSNASSRGLRATMMGVGMSPAVSAAAAMQPPLSRPSPASAPAMAPPPQAQPHVQVQVQAAAQAQAFQPQMAMIGGAAAANGSAAPANGHPAIDMDWDDEELATQVYDKPENMPASMSMPARPSVPPPVPAPSRPPPTSSPQLAAAAQSKMQVGAAAAAVQFAGPRQPTGAMPAAAVAPPPRSLPAIPAPPAHGLGPAGPMPNGYGPAVTAPMGGMMMGQPMGQPMYPQPGMGPPMQGGAMQGGPHGNNGMYAPQYGPPMQQQRGNGAGPMMGPPAQFAQDRQITVAAPPPERTRRSGAVMVFAALGVVAIAALMVVGLRLLGHSTPVAVTPVPPPTAGPPTVTPTVAANPPPVVPPAPVVVPVAPIENPAVAPTVLPVAPTVAVQPVAPTVAPAPVAPTPVAAGAEAPSTPSVAPTPPAVHHRPSASSLPRETVATHAPAPRTHEPTPAVTHAAHVEPAAPSGGETGFFSVSTLPASRCSIAGQTFSTPRIGLELPAGSYRITCQNSDFNVSGSWMVTIHAGQRTMDARHQLN